MKHEKTFSAISKLKEVELELHRLKNALEMANKALDAQRTWVGLTDDEIEKGRDQKFSINNPYCPCDSQTMRTAVRWAEAKLKDKNTRG